MQRSYFSLDLSRKTNSQQINGCLLWWPDFGVWYLLSSSSSNTVDSQSHLAPILLIFLLSVHNLQKQKQLLLPSCSIILGYMKSILFHVPNLGILIFVVLVLESFLASPTKIIKQNYLILIYSLTNIFWKTT